MQTARNYIPNATVNMERALSRMPLAADRTVRPLPASMRDITRHVEDLLTDEEQRICDMATD